MQERMRRFRRSFLILPALSVLHVAAQDNSPYSRYGLGDLVPAGNASTRGMAGISAGFRDPLFMSVNFGNPASYSNTWALKERTTGRLEAGRVVLDVGVNIDSRTLREPNNPQRFTSTNAQFSYVQLALPLKQNWGLAFGIRPLTRVGYKQVRNERLTDPITGQQIENATTEFSGDGGAFLPTIGTGFAIKNFSAGINVGYLFGKKEISTRRTIINDTVLYNPGRFTNRTSFGDLFLNAGVQYSIPLNTETRLVLGVAGNWKQVLSATQDISRETFVRGSAGEEFRLDSVYIQNDIEGEVIFPASFTYGFTVSHDATQNGKGWLIGADLVQSQWSQYRFFGAADSVSNNWTIRVGGQLSPSIKGYSSRGYFQKVTYRAGFFTGTDYINITDTKGQLKQLPVMGVTFGMGLPFGGRNAYARNQTSMINLGLEYSRRGDADSRLKDNLFRVSASFNLADLWFGKRRYD